MPTGGLILIGHGLAGFWTTQVLQFYALALPLVFAAIFLGGKLNRRIPTHRFERLLCAALIVLGGMLLI